MNSPMVAIYARVSWDQQSTAHTIESQLAALQERVVADGVSLTEQEIFIDDGFSGATLVRPALERLRDVVTAGGIDRLYVQAPDRLARKYAYQVLLLDEFKRAGVEMVFLNHSFGQTPEDELLVQVQGMVAEYERARAPRTRAPWQAACGPGGVSGRVGACALRLPLCASRSRRWPSVLRSGAGGGTGRPADV